MCTYSQLKKIQFFFVQPTQGVNGRTCNGNVIVLMSQNCTRLAEKISQNVLKVEA